MKKMLLIICFLCTMIHANEKWVYKIKTSNLDTFPENGKEIFQSQKEGFYRYFESDKLYIAIIHTNAQGETIKAEMQAGDKKKVFTVKDGKLLYDNKELDLKGVPLISFPEVQLKINDIADNAVYEYYSIRTDTLKLSKIIIEKISSNDTETSIQMTWKGIIPSIARWVYNFRTDKTEAFQKSGYFLSGSWYYNIILEE